VPETLIDVSTIQIRKSLECDSAQVAIRRRNTDHLRPERDSENTRMCDQPVATDQSDHRHPEKHRTSCFNTRSRSSWRQVLDKKRRGKLIQRQPAPLSGLIIL
jgi:hypothetical protein